MEISLSSVSQRELTNRLDAAAREFSARYPGESATRQPVHTVYGGAHLFKSDTVAKLGDLALRSLGEYAPTPADLAQALGLPQELGETVYGRVRDKLGREPVEDFRIDFEDGYGIRSDEEEDAHAIAAAQELAKGLEQGSLPPFSGIRVKPFNAELRGRAIRTLDLFLTALCRQSRGIPQNFVITLPKVTSAHEVSVLADLSLRLEKALGLSDRSLRLELMIETAQSIFDDRGRVALLGLVEAAQGRCVSAHFGTYDYTASLNITAAHQSMTHPACDFAKHVMQVALAGTGIWLSDGATTIMPIPKHRAAKGGPPLGPAPAAENRAVVHGAWKLHYDNVLHSLEGGFYQGWDLHPGQLPIRYAAVYAFFLEGLEACGRRLANFVEKAAQATLSAGVFDDAATGQGLLNYFLRAINCGAITEAEALARTGLSLEELASRSFLKILKNR